MKRKYKSFYELYCVNCKYHGCWQSKCVVGKEPEPGRKSFECKKPFYYKIDTYGVVIAKETSNGPDITYTLTELIDLLNDHYRKIVEYEANIKQRGELVNEVLKLIEDNKK